MLSICFVPLDFKIASDGERLWVRADLILAATENVEQAFADFRAIREKEFSPHAPWSQQTES